jgi:membrane fusion protein (multidrug efflux system)
MQPRAQFKKAVVIGAIVVGVIGITKFFQVRAQMAAGGFMPPPEAVTAMNVGEVTWPKKFDFVGTVKSVRGAVFSAEASGRVVSVNSTNANVKAGETLVALDAALEEARLLAAEANERRARAAYERAVSLKAMNSISQASYDQSSSDYSAAKAEVKAWAAEVNKRRVVAPFEGKVGVAKVAVGEFVSIGQPLVPLYDFSELYVDFSLPQQEMSKVNVGQRVSVRAAGRESSFKVTAIDPNLDLQTRTGGVRAAAGKDSKFAPGEYVEGEVIIDESAKAIAVPSSAINFAPYGDSIFTISEKDGGLVVDMNPVTLGEMRGNLVEVLSGIKPGDRIVTSGVFKLRPGAKIIVNDAASPAAQVSADLQRS